MTGKRMRMQEKEKDQLRPVKDTKVGFNFRESCPFCKLRRKLQRGIKERIKESLNDDGET
jgi:hypothetical protein